MTAAVQPIEIATLMEESGVKFGTSGARGLACAMTDRVCYAYTAAFVQHLAESDGIVETEEVALAGDRRPSTPRILQAVAQALRDYSLTPRYFGAIPTPALALHGMQAGVPAIMVTGSHIPDDRNGIKFYRAEGEILKEDEAGIRAQQVIPTAEFDAHGMLLAPAPLPPEERIAYADYVRRFLDFYPNSPLQGRRIALYGHSSVAREALGEILRGLGASVIPLGFSEPFIPVDTEAIRPEDVALARQWAREIGFDAICSADGDGDRPLIGDARGEWLRGDIAGILCARHLGAQVVATPVSSNSAVEKCGTFRRVLRTRIGSPYVIAAMRQAMQQGERGVVGYEANGGFLIGDPLQSNGRTLAPLPTRDCTVVILGVLVEAFRQGLSVEALVNSLPPRFTYSDRLKAFPTEISQARLAELQSGDPARDFAAIEALFGGRFGKVAETDHTDGLRITFENGEVAHIRPSGNAPELRCYNEADSEARAQEMNRQCLEALRGWLPAGWRGA